MTDLLENAELLAFTKTVEAKSLTRAARELGVPRATVGRRLQRLEERLAVRLLRRTTRSIALTEAGDALYRQATIALEAVRNAAASVQRADNAVRGDVRLAAPPIKDPAFYGMLSAFATRFPEVRLQVNFSTEHVDLRRGAYDVAIRGTGSLDPGLVARVLVRSSMIAVASPKYLESAPPLRRTSDLRNHRCLRAFVRGELPQSHWVDRKGRAIQVDGNVISNDIAFLYRAAVAGHGVGFLPEPMVRPSLNKGRLVRVLDRSLEAESVLAVVYPEREYLPRPVRTLIDAIVEWAKTQPESALWPAQPFA